MDGSVPQIIRGEFLYRDNLLVDCGGELKRHPRASEADIKRLLNGKDVKDQVGHWYEAQLIHYSLQRSKDKNTAKVRLQQALNQGKLKSQPPHLADMETQMKKEYAAAVRKAKKGESSKGTKRGRDDEGSAESSKRTKVSVTVDGVSINIDRSDVSEVKSTGVATPKVTPKAAPKDAPKATPAKATKPTPKSKASKADQGSSTQNRTSSTTGKKKAAAELHTDPRNHPDNVFQRSSPLQANSSPGKRPGGRTKQTARKSALSQPAIREMEAQVKRESASNYRPLIKNEPYDDYGDYNEAEYDQDESMDTRPDISGGQLGITGVYNIDCPKLAAQSPEHADKLRLFICVDNEAGLIWGGFELAWKSGVIKIDDIAFNQSLSFGWRARDFEQNGSLRFGKGCFGDVEFYGREQIRGVFHNLFPETVEFSGTRRPGPLWCGKSSYKFKQEWDDYPREAYGR